MRLRLNEQEIIDGVCVFVANEMNTDPEEVNVKEINAKSNGEVIATATCFHRNYTLDSEDILEGIFQFLEEFHSFNREGMHGNLHFNKREGFSSEIVVNE